jgi:hypothetical protein
MTFYRQSVVRTRVIRTSSFSLRRRSTHNPHDRGVAFVTHGIDLQAHRNSFDFG